MADVLRTAFGFSKGYDKTAVIMLIDKLTTTIMEYEDGSISRDEALAKMRDARNYTELPMKRGGFVPEDVDEYLDDLLSKI